jgi:catechol 2,3-dioxygenase-like lactoylglutathione lyase family enzyme
MIVGIDHVALYTAKFNRKLEFYSSAFGFRRKQLVTDHPFNLAQLTHGADAASA